MTKASGRRAPAAARTNPRWRKTFLVALADTSNVAAAAREAGVTVSAVYRARRAEPDFAREWQAALAEGYDNLEMELLSRLRMGETPDATDKRTPVKFDNAMAFRLLSAHRDAVGRQRALRDHEDEATTLASINAKLDMMRAREKAATRLLAEDRSEARAEKPIGKTAHDAG